ncbi:MAG TPA: hypothetical protein VFW80_04300 [Gaiellaceae bacterium]|nr:hypothetical protein [Gaiellaceae bacterium]
MAEAVIGWQGDPPWVGEASERENWDADAWREFEFLRQQVERMGVELDLVGSASEGGVTGMAAYDPSGCVGGVPVVITDERPILQGYRRLVEELNLVRQASRRTL